ncbi:hypothetical protein MOSE0_C05930 [Monosporozyma servazzii]
MISINKRFCVIDGWIIDINKQEVVSYSYVSKTLTPDEQRKAASGGDLKVFSEIDTSNSVIIKITSEELFRYVKTEDVEFVRLPGRVVKKNGRLHNRAKRSVVNEFTLKCHTVTLGGRHKCYLHLSLPEEIHGLESEFYDVPIKNKTKDTTVFTNIVKVQGFNFTSHDYRILKDLLSRNNSSAKYICGDMLKILKGASIKALGVLFGKSIHRGFDKYIMDLLPETLAIYGSRISYLILVLKNVDKLSFFDKYMSTAERVANILAECHTAVQLAEVIGKEVSCLSSGGGDTDFWMTWVYLGAFDFCSWGNSDEVCPCVSIFNYKRLLESLIWVFRFGGVIYGEDKQAMVERWISVESSGNNFVGDIRRLHRHASEEAENTTLTISNTKEQSNALKDNALSYRNIGDALNDLTEAFDEYAKKLSEGFTFADCNQLHSATIGATNTTFKEDQSAISILHNFRRDAFRNMNMRWREQRDKNDINILREVKDIVTQLNKLIMTMVWLSTGMPMGYPELATLTYAGESRNIYIDQTKKRLYLNVKYSKRNNITNRSLFLTEGVSRRLWWTIAILRSFAFVTFHDEIGEYDGSGVIDELYREVSDDFKMKDLLLDNEDIVNDVVFANDEFLRQVKEVISTGSNTAASVLKMFAFVDIKNHRLFELQQVRNLLKVTRHRTKPSYQNMSALWKTFIIPKLNLDAENSISDVVDSRKTIGELSKGRELTFSEMAAAHSLFEEATGLPG